jgi:azurin
MIISKGDVPMEGVLVAQGNNTNGYSLYIVGDALYYFVAQDEKQTVLSSKKALPEEQFTIDATLVEDGTMSLKINGEEIAKGKTKGLFPAELSPRSVRVGRNDSRNVVGKYEGTWWFNGRLSNKSTLALKKPGADVQLLSDEVAAAAANGTTVIKLAVVPHEMKYNKTTFTVKAGSQVTIDFENPDFMQHNLVIGQKGSMETIGKAADEMARDPKGAEQNFVPKIPQVIAATRLVDPEGRESIVFTAPTEPGEYPFVCTVPGHWRLMNGIMKVE